MESGPHHPRKLIRIDEAAGPMTPRARQIHPTVFNAIGSQISNPTNIGSGNNARRLTIEEDSGGNTHRPVVDDESDLSPETFAAPKRKPEKIPPEEAKLAASDNAERDKQALGDAGALWKLMVAPVYVDPLCVEEKSDEVAIRFSQRGLRWVQMDPPHGISLTNRRYRGELRAQFGYGQFKPDNPTPLYEYKGEYDRAMANYVEMLKKAAR